MAAREKPTLSELSSFAWPTVALIALLVFSGPLRMLTTGLAERFDDVTTLKLGSVELVLDTRDLPKANKEIGEVLKSLNADDFEVFFDSFSLSTDPALPSGYCFGQDDDRFKKNERLVSLGLLAMTKDQTSAPTDWCENPHDVYLTPIGMQTRDYIYALVASQLGKAS